MAFTRVKTRKTVEDLMKLPEGTRAELIQGEILMLPSPKLRHQRVVSNVHFAIRQFAESRKLGLVVVAPMDVHLPSGDVVQPDVIFLSASNPASRHDWIRGVPDLLVEVVSPENAKNDLVVKRHLYECAGVREYWIIDPERLTVEALTLSGKVYASRSVSGKNQALTSAVLSDLSLSLREIFA